MRILGVILGVAIIASVFAVLFGDRLLRTRFDIGNYDYTLPERVSVPTETEIRAGLAWSLHQAKLSTDSWVIPATEDWQQSSNQSPEVDVVILLSNVVDGMRLFARVKMVNEGETLRYELYRAK